MKLKCLLCPYHFNNVSKERMSFHVFAKPICCKVYTEMQGEGWEWSRRGEGWGGGGMMSFSHIQVL